VRAISTYVNTQENNIIPPAPSCAGLKPGTPEFKRASAAAMQWKRKYVPGFREAENARTKANNMAKARANGVQPQKRLIPVEGAPPKPRLEGKPGTQKRNDSIAARVRWNRGYVPGWKERINKHDVEYVRRKRQADSDFRLHGFLRTSIGRSMRYTDDKRLKRTLEYVGCSVGELKEHLQAQFTPGMSWKNYGVMWEVDHIIPLASRLPAQITAHFVNLQPLPVLENNAKDKKIILSHVHKIIAHPDVPDELLDVALTLVST
jgi:hypothetical protein